MDARADEGDSPRKRAFFYLGSLLATAAGIAFLGVAGSVATKGTGAGIPAGDGVVEGVLEGGRTVRSPVGDDFLYGEVRITRPGGSAAVDHSWSTPAGDARVVVDTGEGPVPIELPPIAEWRGVVPTEQRQVQHLDGLAIVSEATEVSARMEPPYAIVVRALRAGDALVARVSGTSVTELHIGSRAQLEQDLAQREAMRWPIVMLMGVMGLASLGLGFAAFRRGRGA